MKHREEQLDDFIRSRIQNLNRIKYKIEPSADFTHRVMSNIKILERRRRWMGYLAAIVLSMIPLAAREVWMLIRGDYFSASSLPLGGLIIGAYKFFLSPATLYILLALGILAFLLRANKLRRNFNYNSIRIA